MILNKHFWKRYDQWHLVLSLNFLVIECAAIQPYMHSDMTEITYLNQKRLDLGLTQNYLFTDMEIIIAICRGKIQVKIEYKILKLEIGLIQIGWREQEEAYLKSLTAKFHSWNLDMGLLRHLNKPQKSWKMVLQEWKIVKFAHLVGLHLYPNSPTNFNRWNFFRQKWDRWQSCSWWGDCADIRF